MRDKDRFWRRRKLARFSGLGVRLLCSQGDRTPAAGDLTWTESLDRLTKCKALPIILRGALVHEDAYLTPKYSPSLKRTFFQVIIRNECRRCTASSMHTIGNRKYGVIFHLGVYVDSGIRGGTDVVKDQCLCAKAVGVGFLDGNTYSMDFSHFTEVFPNTVYAMHDYGFPDWRTLCRE